MADTTTGGSSTIDWSSLIKNLATSGLDIYSLITGQDKNNANAAIQIADPILPAQGQALTQLQQFLTDPSKSLQDPAFQAVEQLGAENISRQAGAAGMGASGNRLADLFKFGETSGLQYENQKFNQLMDVLKGSPAAAGILTQGQRNQQGTIGDLLASLLGGGGVGGIAQALPQLFKMLTGGGDGTDVGTGTGVPDLNTIIDQATGGGLEDTSGFWNQGPFGPDPTGISTGDQNIINDILGQGGGQDIFSFSTTGGDLGNIFAGLGG
jgi:hypothetical protein